MRKTTLMLTVAMSALTTPVWAQANKTETASTAEDGVIIVTATKRNQVLSDVPIAVSAVSAEQLKNSGGSDIRSLNQLAPSLLVSTATNDSNAAARIRGIGTVGENPGLESSVAVFIDGVYRSRTGVGLTELGEVDRIEVLRGPQGTLFGRNASAGLINIVTAKPKFDFGGSAEASYGNFNAIRLAGGITGPIIAEKLAARLDAVYNKRDGFLPDVISGRKTANRDRYLLRGQLLFTPSDDWSVRVIGDYSHKNEECCGASYLAPIQRITKDLSGNLVFGPNSLLPLIQGFGGNIQLPTDGSKYARLTSITPGVSFLQKTRDWGVSAEINGKIGSASLTSITAYRQYKNDGAQDGDFNGVDLLRRADLARKFQTFSQEVRLQGKAFNDRLDYLVGGYFASEKLTYSDDLKFGADWERFENALIAPFGVNLNTLATAAGYTPPAGQSLLNGTGIVNDTYRQKDRNFAVFTHNVISIVPDKLLLSVGARYTNDRKTLDASFNHNNGFCGALRAGPFVAPFAALNPFRPTAIAIACAINGTTGPGFTSAAPGATKNEERLTGTAVISFKPVESLLTYASFSRGYKAGGFNLDTAALAPAAPSANDLRFEPEIVNAFEVGAKLNLRQFKLNAAFFYESFKDFQLNLFNGTNFQVTNVEGCKDDLGGRDKDAIAGNSTCPANRLKDGVVSKGVEVEAYIYPARNVTVTAGMTYADTKYSNNLTGSAGSSLGTALFQLPGSRISNGPQYVVTGSFGWTPPISDNLTGLLYLDFRYQSAINTGSDLDFEKVQQGFGLVNGRVGVFGPGRKWGIDLWAQNLLNEKYQQIAADAPAQGSGTFRGIATGVQSSVNQLYITFPAEPRTYGVTLKYKF
jgi:iron complex outermembrane recepter protein